MKRLLLIAAFFFSSFPLFASEGGGHADPVAPVVLAVAVLLLAAKLGGDLAARVGQPAVLGELLVGVILGNLSLFGVDPLALSFLEGDHVDILARIGVLILLFEAGLESTVGEMLRVGISSFLVAILGIVTPFVLGYVVGAWLLPDESVYVHLFLGATLVATSVGITARVLKDLGRSQSKEARVILGAAVIDDVLGLLILAVVSNLIIAADQGTEMSYLEIALILLKATAFLVGSLVIGIFLSPHMFTIASKLRSHGVLLAIGLSVCFLLSWLANLIGLAPIVGAFAAGLILEEVHYEDFTDRGEYGLEHLIQPISSFLVPIFFVTIGMSTNLAAFGNLSVLGLALVLSVAAVIGKQICSLGVVAKGIDKLSVGIGMVPRGEVGLIFAEIGRQLTLNGKPVVDESVFSAVVVMVMITTMVTPPGLKWSFSRLPQPKIHEEEEPLPKERTPAIEFKKDSE